MWLSVHIFHKNHLYSYESDRIILEVVKPFVEMCERENLTKKYFFIRYSENGPHIRLRLEVETPERLIELKRMLTEYIPEKYPEELHIEENNSWNNNSVYQFIEYEPEVDRYGGAEGIKIAEEYFYYSSRIAISLIEKIHDGNNSERLGKGIISNTILLKCFVNDIRLLIRFLENYSSGYLKSIVSEDEKEEWVNAFDKGFEKQENTISEFISQLWTALNGECDLDKDTNEFIESTLLIKNKLLENLEANIISKNNLLLEKWEDVILYLLPSYIHMMNNRLGISIREESYIAHLIKNVFHKLKIPEVS